MGRYLIIPFLLGFFFLVPETLFAQKVSKKENFKENHTPFGRRKKEKKNQHGTSNAISRRGGIFKRKGNNGNANSFASNSISGSKGFFSKILHPNRGTARNASIRKTKPGKVQNKEQSKLFGRIFTKNKARHEMIQTKQRKERGRNRKRGNNVFPNKKR